MSRKKKRPGTAKSTAVAKTPAVSQRIVADPPVANRSLLQVTRLLLAAWTLFLLVLALAS